LLTGELRRPGQQAGASGSTPARRLSAVPDQDELPLGDDAIALVRERELTRPEPEPVAEQPATEQPATEQPATEQPATEEPVAEEPVTEEPVEEPVAQRPAAEPAVEEPGTEEPAARTEEPPARPRRKGRASVPSWDEIMFGGGKGE
jgi:hypothetical protein